MFALLLLTCAAEPSPQFEVVNKTAPAFVVVNKATDPYRMEYKAFYEWITGGGKGVMVVGIPDRFVGGYETHCWVPSGFGGIKDGEYDCFGRNEMTPRKTTAPAVAATPPFQQRAVAVAPPAGTAGRVSASPVAAPAVLRVVPFGSNCAVG